MGKQNDSCDDPPKENKNYIYIRSNIVHISGENPSQATLSGTNIYILGSGLKRTLVEAGDFPESNSAFLSHIIAFLDDHEDVVLNRVLITHAHPDHMGGLDDILSILRDRGQHPEVFKHLTNNKFESHFFTRFPNTVARVQNIDDGQEFVIDEGEFFARGVYTPGHLDDHVSFLLTSTRMEDRILICGDIILGSPSGVVEDLDAYMKSLKLVRDMKLDFLLLPHSTEIGVSKILVPAKEKIDLYIKYQETRIEQVKGCFGEESTVASREDIYEVLYGSKNLHGVLKKMAHVNLDLRINKLITDCYIEVVDNGVNKDKYRLLR